MTTAPVGTTSVNYNPLAQKIKNDMPITWALNEIKSHRFSKAAERENAEGGQHFGEI